MPVTTTRTMIRKPIERGRAIRVLGVHRRNITIHYGDDIPGAIEPEYVDALIDAKLKSGLTIDSLDVNVGHPVDSNEIDKYASEIKSITVIFIPEEW